jgi:hypothetical protein
MPHRARDTIALINRLDDCARWEKIETLSIM